MKDRLKLVIINKGAVGRGIYLELDGEMIPSQLNLVMKAPFDDVTTVNVEFIIDKVEIRDE